jgi:hypothetical protein
MAIAIDTGRRPASPRPLWMRRQTAEPEAALTGLMLGLLLAGFLVAALVPQILDSVPLHLPRPRAERTNPARPTAGVVPPAAPAQAEAAPLQGEPAVEPAVRPTAPEERADAAPGLTVGARARVANTDGLGVVLHTAPRADARQPAGLLEGTRVTVVELVGAEWARVQAENRQGGWVATTFLAATE